ncbi:MAG: hypothetical protein E7547_00020 [Ruminococcaceae bacterium]|nr:hypothetical protein [Oscillospiraceae bacterium]
MAVYSPNLNKEAKNHGKRKKLIVAVSVIAALSVLLVVFLASKNTVFFAAAKNKAEKYDFETAIVLAENSGNENSGLLRDYINLRLEINGSYPMLLSDFDVEKIKSWAETAERIGGQSECLGEKISDDLQGLSQTLSEIIYCESEYKSMRADILNLMDVFNEINRLHTKDAEGKNISFTISEERTKLNGWSLLNSGLLSFISRIPGNEKIYLINYLAKEAQGEISEINSAIDSVAASGYSDTDLVRFSGEAVRRFPDISNSSGESVNLLDKEKYEQFMYDEMCRILTETLAPYYVAK